MKEFKANTNTVGNGTTTSNVRPLNISTRRVATNAGNVRASKLSRGTFATQFNHADLARSENGFEFTGVDSLGGIVKGFVQTPDADLATKELERAGVNICLGTDSLVSVKAKRGQHPKLDLFDEMRAMSSSASDLSARSIVQMATLNGARALGRAGNIGEITPGALADLITIPCDGAKIDPHEIVLNHRGPVSASMINGQWVLQPK